MNQNTYNELEQRSDEELKRAFSQITQKQAESVIHRQLENLKAQDKILILTDEEERLLAAFRRFKARCRKDGMVFTWQTRREPGIIQPQDGFLIESPEEMQK